MSSLLQDRLQLPGSELRELILNLGELLRPAGQVQTSDGVLDDVLHDLLALLVHARVLESAIAGSVAYIHVRRVTIIRLNAVGNQVNVDISRIHVIY